MSRADVKATYVARDMWVAYATRLLEENPLWWSRYQKNVSHHTIYRKRQGRVEEVMSYPLFKEIIEDFFTRAKGAIIQGEALNMRHRLGKICARRVERDFRKKAQRKIDWSKTRKQPLVWDEQQQKHVYQNKVFFVGDDWCRIGLHKTGQIPNERSYEFSPAAQNSDGTSGFRREFVDALNRDPLLKYKYLFNPIVP